MRHTRSHRIHEGIPSIPPESKEQAAFRCTPDTACSLGRLSRITPSAAGSLDLGFLGVVVREALLKDRPLAGSEAAEDALQVLHGGELHRDLALLLPQIDLHPRLETVRETRGEVRQRRGHPGSGPRALG